MFTRFNRLSLLLLIGYGLSALLFVVPQPAQAYIIPSPCLCVSTDACEDEDCDNTEEAIEDTNKEGVDAYLLDNDHSDTEDSGDDFNGQFNDYERWLLNFAKEQITPAMQRMTRQLVSVAMHQVFVLGTFLDAELQLGTQRAVQKLKVEAHRDYQPSEDFCWFGTGVRSMAATEARSRYHSQALNARQMARHLGEGSQAAGTSKDGDKQARWDQFTKTYCDPRDNHWNSTEDSGLAGFCTGNSENAERVNIDIDYTRLIDTPRTLDVDFDQSDDRQDVFALGNNLYGHDVLTRDVGTDYLKNEASHGLYLALRAVAARRNVAENSYNAIVELKASGTSDIHEQEATRTREFLAAILTEMGVPEGEVFDYIGERPSYYAQLEILAKKIYQNPDFYANLYDKPANVARKGVALKAIELMLDRAIYESQLRREMATSVLLSTKLRHRLGEASEQATGGGG